MIIKVPLHSFIDLITNSSSEVFVSATTSTIKCVKDIVNHLLKAYKVDKTCDDIFDIDIESGEENEYGSTESWITIKPKTDDPDLAIVAKQLEGFINTYEIEDTL